MSVRITRNNIKLNNEIVYKRNEEVSATETPKVLKLINDGNTNVLNRLTKVIPVDIIKSYKKDNIIYIRNKFYKKKWIMSRLTQEEKKENEKEHTEYEKYHFKIIKQLKKADYRKKIKIDLTKANLKILLDEILEYVNLKKEYFIIHLGQEKGHQIYTLTHKFLEKIDDLYSIQNDINKNGSDLEVVQYQLKNANIYIQKIRRFKKKKIIGGFFSYFNLTHFDLERYDIYKTFDKTT
jgi:hypothetical protein